MHEITQTSQTQLDLVKVAHDEPPLIEPWIAAFVQ